MSFISLSFSARLLLTSTLVIAAYATPLILKPSMAASPGKTNLSYTYRGSEEHQQLSASDRGLLLPPKDSWFDYLVNVWNYSHDHTDYSYYHHWHSDHYPHPTPSHSPVPVGTGVFPEHVGPQKSVEGFNEASSKKFVLNKVFYHKKKDEAPLQVYKESKAELYKLMGKAERGSLSWLQRRKWEKIIKAILESYKQECGAVFYDYAFSKCWKYCGWVQMAETFVPTSKAMRVCVSLTSLGLDDITRPPEEGKDFFIPGYNDTQATKEMLGSVLHIDQQDLQETSRRMTEVVSERYVVVDLLNYPDFCEYPLDVDPNCYGFCCMSPYYGSDFCNDCSI